MFSLGREYVCDPKFNKIKPHNRIYPTHYGKCRVVQQIVLRVLQRCTQSFPSDNCVEQRPLDGHGLQPPTSNAFEKCHIYCIGPIQLQQLFGHPHLGLI